MRNPSFALYSIRTSINLSYVKAKTVNCILFSFALICTNSADSNKKHNKKPQMSHDSVFMCKHTFMTIFFGK